MELYRFRLTPADRKTNLNFLEIEHSHGLFTTAAKNCSQGFSFKRDGKKITVDEITGEYIVITLYSAKPLSSPSRTLAAFSRELLRLDKRTRLLESSIYNHTLFYSERLEISPGELITADDISDTALLKAIIDLLYSPTEDIDDDAVQDAKNALKEIMLPFMGGKVQ